MHFDVTIKALNFLPLRSRLSLAKWEAQPGRNIA
jgi:hypothetical protein